MTFLNVVEIESALIALNNAYPGLTELILLPNPTAEGRRSHALVIHANTTYDCRPALIFVSGVHAREWGGPDTLVNLAADLLEAYTTGSGLTYGGRSFTATEIVNLVDRTDVVVFPDQNPDGRAFSMAAAPGSQQSMWRKNRNTASSSGNPARIGVDINRNYDFLWDYTTAFHPNVSPASNNPGSDTYHGTGPFSEPEARNAQWLVDRFPRAAYFVDVHSYSGLVLYPWGDDEDQTTDPAINFQNGTWNGQRGLRNDAYRDYVPPARLPQLQTAAGVLRDAIQAVRGQSYVRQQVFDLYPTSGTSADWAFTREFRGYNRLTGLAIEFNKQQTFFPTWTEMVELIKDVDAGLVALCVHATPSRWAVIICWIRGWFFAEWKRLWPWDLWGPYGPWGRVQAVINPIIEVIASAVVQVAKSIASIVSRR